MSETTMPAPLVAAEHAGTTWNLTFEGFTEAGAVGGFLWPDGVPAEVHILPLVVVEEPTRAGQFEFTGLSVDAIQSMELSIRSWLAQESVMMTADPSDSPERSGSTQPDPNALTVDQIRRAAPVVDVKMDESRLAEYVHSLLETTERIGAVADVLEPFLAGALAEKSAIAAMAEGAEPVVAEGSALAEVAEVAEILGPVGHIATVIVATWTVVRALTIGPRLQEQKGFCYGLMWETFGMPNGKEQAFLDWDGDSADDLRQAFFDGVAQGREKVQDVKIPNAIMADVAYYMAFGPGSDAGILSKAVYDSGDRFWAAQKSVINDLWSRFREDEHNSDLEWPDPANMAPHIPG